MSSSRFFAGAVALCAQLFAFAHAEDQTHYDEPGIHFGRDYLSQHFSERIDPFSGNLSLQQVDLSIPGNAGFDLSVQRSYNANAAIASGAGSSPFGRGWEIHFGRVAHVAGQTCANAATQSLNLELADGSRETFHRSNGAASTSTSDYLTTTMWKGRCDPAGMIVYAPNGTMYEMTEADGSYWHAKRITDRFGNSMTLSYVLNTTAGRKVVSQVSASDGRFVTFSYAADKLSSVSGGGVVWTYSVQPGADGSNQLMQVTPPAGGSWQYAYNGNTAPSAGSFMLNQMINPLQGIIQYSYALVNFLPNISGWAPVSAIRQKVAGANVWTFSYSPGCGSGTNDTTTVSLPTGDTIQYKHFGYCNVNNGDVWKIGLLYQKFMGSVQSETFTWTPQSVSDEVLSRPAYAKSDTQVNRALLSQRNVMRDGVGYNTTYAAFDSFGNPQSVQESGNASRSKSINYFNSASAWILGVRDDETISGAGTIARSHGVNGELLSESPFGVTTTFAYNYDGTLSSKTTAKPASTSFSNYRNGVARTESRPQGVVISRSVDALGRITSQTDGEFTWTYGYDGIGRVTSIGFPAGANATISWTTTSKTLTRGGLTIATHFDAFGNATRVTRGGIATSYDYDGLGRKTFESLPGSLQGSTYTYDVLGRITRIQSPAGTRTIQYSGNSTTVTDERGKSIRSDYARYGDPDEGYVTYIAAPVSAAPISMSRNAIGTLLSATQNGITRTYGRDSHWFLTSISEPEVGTTSFGRDGVGNMTSRTVGGRTASYTYDGLNRLTAISASAISVSIGYNARGKVTSVENASAGRSYSYDSDGNLTQDRLTIDGQVFTIDYGYDALDGLASISYNGRGVVTYSPNVLGRPTQAYPYLSSVSHYDSGNLQSITFGNGIVQSYSENNRQLPSSITAAGAQLGLSYAYDPAGNVTSITDSYVPGASRTMGYDDINRLVTANGPWGSGSISYDGSGNITRQAFGSYAINYSYGGNRLASITGSVSRSFTYDGAGNVTGDGEKTLAFDALSEMSCAKCGTASEVSYRYDGQGRRVSQLVGGKTTYFVQASNGDLQYEYTPYGKVWTKHIYLHGKRVASETGSDATPTSTAVTSSPSSPQFPATVTITAAISPSAATGTVQFIEGDRSLGTAAVASGRASIDLATLPVGTHTITATYSGDASYQPSTSSAVVTVAPQATSVSLSGVPATASLGQSIVLTASVSGSSPTGQVEFRDGGTVIGMGSVNASIATFTVTAVLAGNHSYTATYLGDANHRSATSGIASTVVSKGSPTMSLASSAPSVTTGQAVTFTASIAGVANVPPTGSVEFMDGPMNTLGNVNVSGGTAMLTTTSMSVGSHQIIASYTGDANYAPASSPMVNQQVNPANFALASMGGVASASSTYSAAYPVSAVNDNERAGMNWGSGGGWNDATPDGYPDWVQIDFNGPKSINQVVVYTLQDNYASPVEPTDAATFSLYGVTDFTVQGWNGTSWVTLGSVAGNNLVKHTVTTGAFTTDRIRVNIANASASYSRIIEIETWGTAAAWSTNVALASAGAVASASSTYSAAYPVSAVNDNERAGMNWGSGGGWNDATAYEYPDWVQINFNGPKSIDRVVVYTLQDNYASPVEPTDATTFSLYGVMGFDVQAWNGSSWVTLATVSGNNLVKRTVNFAAFTTDRIRVNSNYASANYSRITEIEAWGVAATSGTNVALASAGAVASASSIYSAAYPVSAVNDNERAGMNWGSGGGWNDATPDGYPDWVQIAFNGPKSINQVVVYTLQDNYASPVEPTDATTFSLYGATDFTVQGWNGTSWVTLGSVAGNNLVKRSVNFGAFTTDRVRVNVTGALGGQSRIVEVEAWGQ